MNDTNGGGLIAKERALPDEAVIYKEALRLMAIDYIDTMREEASSGWADWDTELGNWVMRPRVSEGPIFDEFVQRYIKEAKEKVKWVSENVGNADKV